MKKHDLFFVFLFLFLVIPLGDLFNLGLPITHDGQDHVARIANFYANLQEGVLIPRWAENLNWGYGHPILMFLYPLPSYVTSLFHFLGFTFVDSLKIFFGLAFIASGLAMYLWLKEFLSREAAFIGALLYTFAPYRFVDLYVRGAIGEHAAFVFPPLVLYFLFKLSQIPRPAGLPPLSSQAGSLQSAPLYLKGAGGIYMIGGTLSLAGLILAHNAISLMFLPIIFLYAAYLFLQTKNKKFFLHLTSYVLILGFSLSAFFWLPAFAEGKYTLRDIVTASSVFDRFVPLEQLFYGPWGYGVSGYFSVQVGLLHWLFVVLSIPFIFILKKKRNPNWILLAVSSLFYFLTVFLMTVDSRFIWEKISILQKFQFPWRFLSLSVFLTAFIGAVLVHESSSLKVFKSSRKRFVILILLVAAILFLNKDYWHAKDYSLKPEKFYTDIFESTTDTGESAPIWSVRFMEKKPKAHMEIIDGQAKIVEKGRTSTYHSYVIEAGSKVKLKENTLYFPGWKVLVDGKEVPVEFQNQNHRGLMTFFVQKGEHDVVIKFEETKLRLFADIVSGLSLLILVLLGMLRKKIFN